MSDDISSSLNVIAVTFTDDSNAYEALTTLKELESQRQIGIRGAAVVARDDAGQILDKDQLGDHSYVGTQPGASSICSSGSSAARSGS